MSQNGKKGNTYIFLMWGLNGSLFRPTFLHNPRVEWASAGKAVWQNVVSIYKHFFFCCYLLAVTYTAHHAFGVQAHLIARNELAVQFSPLLSRHPPWHNSWTTWGSSYVPEYPSDITITSALSCFHGLAMKHGCSPGMRPACLVLLQIIIDKPLLLMQPQCHGWAATILHTRFFCTLSELL